jgi:hypothetical protein
MKPINIKHKLWIKNFSLLKEYLKKHDNVYPRKNIKNSTENKLASWICYQRRYYREKILPAQYISKLQSLPDFNFDAVKQSWLSSFYKLSKFMAKNGELPSILSYDINEIELFIWARTQKFLYSKGCLEKYKVDLFKDLYGWVWDMLREHWHKMYSELKKFLNNNNGKCPSVHSKDQHEKKLGVWATNHRSQYKKGKLSANRVYKLNSIDGWRWDLLKERRKMYEEQ